MYFHANALFIIISLQDVLHGFNMWIIVFFKTWIQRNIYNLYQQVDMDFWMIKIEPYFQKFLPLSFFWGLIFCFFNMDVK